jgi:nitroreductase
LDGYFNHGYSITSKLLKITAVKVKYNIEFFICERNGGSCACKPGGLTILMLSRPAEGPNNQEVPMFIDLIRKRRSIRRYDSTAVEESKIETLIEAALRAPSSRGFNPWEFITVTDRETLKRLSKAKPHGASFLAGAPLGIVVCADTAKSDVWVEDAAIATIFIQLAAESLGLGSCWIQIRKRLHDDDRTASAYIAELLHLPPRLTVESMVAVGYPAEDKKPHAAAELQYEKVFLNRYDHRFLGPSGTK